MTQIKDYLGQGIQSSRQAIHDKAEEVRNPVKKYATIGILGTLALGFVANLVRSDLELRVQNLDEFSQQPAANVQQYASKSAQTGQSGLEGTVEVQSGDTVFGLATRSCGTTVEAFRKENNLYTDLIYPGEVYQCP